MALTINLAKLERNADGTRKPRPLVLTCTMEESYEVQSVLFSEVLRPAGEPPCVAQRLRSRDLAKFRIKQKHLEKLKLVFPYAHISPGLDKRIVRAARAEYEDMPVPEVHVPGMRKNISLMGHQAIAVDRITTKLLVDEADVFFLNDEMGLGKTLMGLSFMQVMRHSEGFDPESFSALAIVPNGIKYTAWLADLRRFFGNRIKVNIVDSEKQTPAERSLLVKEQATLTIVNPESLWRISELTECQYDLIIVDEYHRFKTPTARQTQAFLDTQAAKYLLMSGTPILNGRPEELWTVLHKAWPERYTSPEAFASAHIIKSRRRTQRPIGYRGLGDIQRMIDPVEERRRKDHVLRDLPDKVYQRIMVKMSTEQRRTYERIRDDMLVELEDGGHRRLVNVLAQITRLKQACFSPELFAGKKKSAKIDKVKELVAELHSNGEKAIIFSQWSKATRILQRELTDAGYNVAYIDGTVAMSKRTTEIERFQTDDDCTVFVGTIGSCKEGITLTAASYVIFTDKGWTPAENEQAAARAHRIGQQRTVNVIEIFAEDTLEADLEDMLQQKQNTFNVMIESDGGVRNTRMDLTDLRNLIERY